MKKDKRKKWLASAAALAAIAALVGTFAWFTSKDQARNEFEGALAGNDIEIVEDFTPPEKWEPGAEVNKDVAVKNTGDYKSLIRVSLNETIKKLVNSDSQFASTGSGLTKDAYLFLLRQTDLTGYSSVEFSGTAPKLEIPNTVTQKVNEKSVAGNYTLKVVQKESTVNGGTKYEYISFWENNSEPTIKLHAKTGGYVRDEADKTKIKIRPGNKAEFQYVNLEYAPEINGNWAGTPGHTPVPSIDGDGSAAIWIEGKADKLVKIEFINLSKDAKQGKWTYNQADGHFYYVGVVDPGAQTAQLIDSVKLDEKADNEYSKVKYKLEVNAKGIQAVKAAVNSDQWLNNTNSTLATVLEGLPGVVQK